MTAFLIFDNIISPQLNQGAIMWMEDCFIRLMLTFYVIK